MPTKCYLGKDAAAYVNTGTTATPIWTLVNNIKDLRLTGTKSLADVTTRGSNGYRQQCPTLKEIGLEFECLHDPADTEVELFQGSFFNGTAVEMLVLTQLKDQATTQGIRATFQVSDRPEDQPLEQAISNTFTMVIAPGTTPSRITAGPIA